MEDNKKKLSKPAIVGIVIFVILFIVATVLSYNYINANGFAKYMELLGNFLKMAVV